MIKDDNVFVDQYKIRKFYWAEIQIPTLYHDKGKGVKLWDAISVAFFIAWLRLTKR